MARLAAIVIGCGPYLAVVPMIFMPDTFGLQMMGGIDNSHGDCSISAPFAVVKTALSGEYDYLTERAKMPLCCDQDTPHTENDGNIGRKVLLMFTLSGFGGAASLAVAEAMIDSNSNGGAASASALATYSAGMPTYP